MVCLNQDDGALSDPPQKVREATKTAQFVPVEVCVKLALKLEGEERLRALEAVARCSVLPERFSEVREVLEVLCDLFLNAEESGVVGYMKRWDRACREFGEMLISKAEVSTVTTDKLKAVADMLKP